MEQLNAITYEAYCTKFAAVPRATGSLPVDVLHYTEFVNSASGTEEARVVTAADGSEALYTPNTGTVTWTLNVPSTAKYSIVIEYWPDTAKSASIERILKIGGAIPFAEARYLTLPQVWKNQYDREGHRSGRQNFRADAV